MSKYTFYSNKEDWKNLYKEFEILNNVHGMNVDIKKVKRSSSYDTWWSILGILKEKLGLTPKVEFENSYNSVEDYINRNNK
tara:strand:+ start:317 stop:559 length:243 start_codon:yes stop_codon:yes gene_type:complete